MQYRSIVRSPLTWCLSLALLAGCTAQDKTWTRNSEPPHGNDIAGNWDPDAAHVTVTPVMNVSPVRNQTVLVATVTDAQGMPLGGRRVEWILPGGSVGTIVDVDKHGVYTNRGAPDAAGLERDDLGAKLGNSYAVTHTNTVAQVLDMGTSDPKDDITVLPGQTWISLTSSSEGTTDVIAYAPGIHSWADHKAFATQNWMDVSWDFPLDATNRIGTDHKLMTTVVKASDQSALTGYMVTYKIMSGPPATFDPGGKDSVTVASDGTGVATATLKQVKPAAGANEIAVTIVRPGRKECCEPEKLIATGVTHKLWVAPTIGINKTAPAQAAMGENFNYGITVSNDSKAAAHDAVVTDVLPDGIAYVSSTPAAKVDGQKLSWTLGTVEAGTKRDLAVTVKATKAGKFTNCADVAAEAGLSGHACADTVVTAPALALVKTASPEGSVCDGITYKYVVTDGGSGPANNVKISDTLPAGLTAEGGGSTVNIAVGTLKAGESKTFTAKVSASKPGEYTNKAVATADGGLKAESSAKTVLHKPVLTITKKAPDKSFIGRPISYEMTVTNTGDMVSAGTTVEDTLPAGAKAQNIAAGGTSAAGKVTWNVGDLAPKASKTLTLTIVPTTAGNVVNTVTAKGACADLVSAQATTKVEGIPALLLEVVDVNDPIDVGSNEVYVIDVTNQGSANDENVVITATLPKEMSFISAEGPSQFTVQGNTVTFAAVPTIAPHAKITFKVTGKANSAGDLRFAAKMTSSSLTSPVDETEATRAY